MSKVPALGVLFAAAAFITLMNQLLCWFCPPACDVRANGLEWIVCRTVSKSMTGLLLCGMAIAVGWRRWLSAGPFVCLAWLCLAACAVAFPQVDDCRGRLAVGPLEADVLEPAPLALGLVAAWFSRGLKPSLGADRWLASGVVAGFAIGAVVFAVKGSLLAAIGGELAGVESTDGYVDIVREVERQCAVMVRESRWFGAAEAVEKAPWCAFAAAVPSAAAFGTWYRVLLGVAACLLVAGFAMAWRCAPSGPKKSLVAVLGTAAACPLIMDCLGCMLCEPLMTVGILWPVSEVSIGAAGWLGLGVVAACLLDDEESSRDVVRRFTFKQRMDYLDGGGKRAFFARFFKEPMLSPSPVFGYAIMLASSTNKPARPRRVPRRSV